MKNIMAIVAHPDDEVIGLGGTLIKHVEDGDAVKVIFLADGKSSRDDYTKEDLKISRAENAKVSSFIGYQYERYDLKDNQLDRYKLLKIVKIIENEVKKFRPSIIYTHCFQDINIDHQITTLATITAIRPLLKFDYVRDIIFFETLSETEWGPHHRFENFSPNLFIQLSKEQMDKKMITMSMYKSELCKAPHPRTDEIIQKNNSVWGAKAGFEYCEAFQIFRSFR